MTRNRRKRNSLAVPEFSSSQEEDFGAAQTDLKLKISNFVGKAEKGDHQKLHSSTLEETKLLLAIHERTAAIEDEVNSAALRMQEVDSIIVDRFSRPQKIEKFNIGGQHIVVPLTNLKFSEGSFFEALLRGELPVQRDENGCIFIDRDPEVFKIIMNYLRGYATIPNLTLSLAHKILCDAEYYQLDSLAETMRYHVFGTSPSLPHQFTAPGAGINVERNRFKTIYNVSPLGDRLLLSGRHSVTFEIKKAEYVGLGVISDECTVFDAEFHRVRNCCVYYMTGIIYTNFPNHKKEESTEKFGSGDFVTIVIDMCNHVVEYRLRNSIRCFSCATATRLRFAVVMKFDSEVSIVGSKTEEPTRFETHKTE